ncbi:MAG: hypothetical protein R3D53_04540 [Paracoccaceae bacterium]
MLNRLDSELFTRPVPRLRMVAEDQRAGLLSIFPIWRATRCPTAHSPGARCNRPKPLILRHDLVA